MNNEILEISKWLSEKGFEADMWHTKQGYWEDKEKEIGQEYKESSVFVTGHKYIECEDSYYVYEVDEPFFTLNRVLELLPEKIRKEEKYYVYGCEENYFKMDFYLGINKKGIGYISDNLGIKKDNAALWESVGKGSIHLSALRLLKKTVEEEYVNEKS